MPTLRTLCAALRRLPVVLALLALGILPPGVMPAPGQDGGMVMVICSGGDAVNMVLDPATGTYVPATPVSEKPGCDWAMAHGTAVLVLPAPLPLPAFATRRAAPALSADLWRPAHDPRGVLARGPPVLI